MSEELDRTLRAYVDCAIWAGSEEMPPDAGPDDLGESVLEDMAADVADFLETNAEDISLALEQAGYTLEDVGHDFWLTRNRHGAGFWDRGLGDVGDRLSEMARPYGETDLYVGDDGLIYAG